MVSPSATSGSRRALSPELGLIVAPRETYAALARGGDASLITALRRPLLAALLLGVSIAVAATHSVTPALVASTTLSWSYVVVVQLAIALPLIAGPARRTVGLIRAVDLFFAGHAPWSIFALFAAAWGFAPSGAPSWPLAVAAIVPIVLTVRIVDAFFTEVLALAPTAARRRTILQQAITWTVFVAVNWVASAFTPRLIGELARW
jgi:hypothetical protein